MPVNTQPTNIRNQAAAAKAAAQRKKLIVAFALLAVMGLLWLRVLAGKKTPKTAAAVAVNNSSVSVQAVSQAVDNSKITYRQLPVVEHRHGVLANDFFDAKKFRDFGSNGKNSQMSYENSSDITAISAAVEQMELTAIVDGKNPQAFIEDKLVEAGQKFSFEFHQVNYEFKVLKIYNNKVDLICKGVVVTKKIPDSIIGTDK